MFKKLISGRFGWSSIYQSFREPMINPRKFITGTMVVTGTSLVLVSGYEYKEYADLYKVIERNNLIRDQKISKSWKQRISLSREQITREVELYLIDSVIKNNIKGLEFILSSKLSEYAPWCSYLLLNQCIRESNLEILNFVAQILDSKRKTISDHYISKMYQCIVRSQNLDNTLILSLTNVLSKHAVNMSHDQKCKMIDKVFWQISRINTLNNGKVIFEKVRMLLDLMIMDGCDPDAIDFRHIMHVNCPVFRELLTRYLIENKMNIGEETMCGKNPLFLIEEKIKNDTIRVNEWTSLHNLITSSTSLKESGTDINGMAPLFNNQEVLERDIKTRKSCINRSRR